ncbi:hypothetical protein POPTR_003G041400v4 [Populus trichocarpa]|uniref:Uncharacterized protein n=1 Tax=Populus trichocarpa TaxID=3694 RepID=A0ACC0T7C2_POPTR|nr:hypothetical protein POPTR_003G041400v4 [Populus trichocarpa]
MGVFLQMLTVLLVIMMVSLQGWLPLGCLDEERIALLQLKDSLNYPNGTSLPSWIKADAHCCSWERIECSTGRVTELHLEETRNEELGDWYLNASLLLPFQELKALNLRGNRLAGWVEKKESLSSLEVLGLSGNNIDKLVASRGPSNLTTLYLHDITTYESSFQLLQSLGAFPSLMTLYLNKNDFRGRILGDELQNLSSLKSLYMDGCSLDEHSLQSLGALPSLKNLLLRALSGSVPSRGFLDLKNLEYLDLNLNTLNNSIFQAIRMMTFLKALNLHGCKLDGRIPLAQGFLNLKNLEHLDLSSNTLDNSIFQTIGLCDLNHLQQLYMYDNDLSGFLPPCLANLTSLQQLDLSFNHLKIPMSLSPLYNLSKLKYFIGSDNEIYAEEDDHSLSPKFQLESISLSNRGQGAGAFPKFLYHQFSLQSFDLTNIQIKGEFPNWLIENNTHLHDLSLENCSLLGPFLLPKNSHVNLSFLSISMNYFQGQIPLEIGARLPGLEVLFMSSNGFNGSIPFSLGNISSLKGLDLSNNSLQGQIPGWIGNMSSLEFLNLSGNNFSGRLPPRFDTSNLRYVYLSRNKLQGPIAMTFYNSFEMFALDLSHNNLTGSIPKWIDRLSNLRFLLLSYNNLEGEIPIRLCRLDQLTLIDLSHNHFSGNILSWMISSHPFPQQYDSNDYLSSSQQSFEFTTKNVSLSYRGSIIQYFTGIDFSCNNFIGEIPPEIGNLSMIKSFSVWHTIIYLARLLRELHNLPRLKRAATRTTLFFVENRYSRFAVRLCHRHQRQLQRTMKMMVASSIWRFFM